MNQRRKKLLVDSLMDAYVSWREACLRVSDTYGSWTGQRGLRATAAYESYIAALDREESAAESYALLVRQTVCSPRPAGRAGGASRIGFEDALPESGYGLSTDAERS